MGEWLALTTSRIALRVVPGKIHIRGPSPRIRRAPGAGRTGDCRSQPIRARRHFAKSPCSSALRQGRQSDLHRKTSRKCPAGYKAEIKLERAGSIKVKALKSVT